MASLASKIKRLGPIPTGMPLSSQAILLGMRMRCLRRIRRLSTRLETRRQIKTSWPRISAFTSDWLKSSLVSRGIRLWINLNRPRKQWTAAILSVAQVESNRDACLPPPMGWAVTLAPHFSPPRSSSRDPLSAACNDAWVNPSSQSSLRNKLSQTSRQSSYPTWSWNENRFQKDLFRRICQMGSPWLASLKNSKKF